MGDLNFSISSWKIWCHSTRPHPFSYFISRIILDASIIDHQPIPLGATWCNGSGGTYGVAERLDMFLISEYYKLKNYKTMTII